MNILDFWGKARPLDTVHGPEWHPLAYHSLDVAAVGEALLTGDRGFGECFSRLLGLPREEADPLICYLLAQHDIGKFARKFQAKAPHVYPNCFGDDPAGVAAHYDHGAGGLRLFDVDTGGVHTAPRNAQSHLAPVDFSRHGPPRSTAGTAR